MHDLCRATFNENSFTFGSCCHGKGRQKPDRTVGKKMFWLDYLFFFFSLVTHWCWGAGGCRRKLVCQPCVGVWLFAVMTVIAFYFGWVMFIFFTALLEGQFLPCIVRYFNLTLIIKEPLLMTMITSLILPLWCRLIAPCKNSSLFQNGLENGPNLKFISGSQQFIPWWKRNFAIQTKDEFFVKVN